MDGLPGRSFSNGSVFPDNKAFRKLRSARCLIENGKFTCSHISTDTFPVCQNRHKKTANLFLIYCFMCCCGAAGYSIFIVVKCGKLEVVDFFMCIKYQCSSYCIQKISIALLINSAVPSPPTASIFSVNPPPPAYIFPRPMKILFVH